ncbi:MAG TPA: energy transducer TonB [Gammaproteobacteria bacterium]|nr:energy transducer TonB [Gammaproteobacteria bacterium]
MSSSYYQYLALRWRPEGEGDFQFKIITAAVVGVMFFLALIVSSISVPEKKRLARQAVPERIAKFILEKKQTPQPVVKKPKPKPRPKPKPEPVKKQIVKKNPKKKEDVKPLTKKEKVNRDRAAESGLLALSNELADLMDTSDLSSMVGGEVNSSSASATRVTSNNKELLMAGTSAGSGGVDSSKYNTTRLSQTRLSKRELTQVEQSLISPEAQLNAKKDSKRKKKSRTGGIREEESITIVFDQNKSKLYSIYNRARRKDPSLKGKIVLKITILPSGKVSKIKVLSSELNNSKLESRLVSRIKQFNFGAMKVETVTVTYPIEFLPS